MNQTEPNIIPNDGILHFPKKLWSVSVCLESLLFLGSVRMDMIMR